MNVEETSKYLKLIADPNRLIIINLLTKKLHMYGNELLKEVSCGQPTLSHHLSELTESGLLNSKKRGNKVAYSINAIKYNQFLNSLSRLDRNINKTNENPIRVTETKLVDEEEVKEKLPVFLL